MIGVAPTGAIRVLVADDQAIVRDGLVTVLSLLGDIDVVAEAADGLQAVELAALHHPDVVLMDLRMPVLDGAGATARILAERPGTAVLVLTTFADDASIVTALRAGARGYLTKDAGRSEVAAAIRAVASGQTTFAAGVGDLLIGSFTGSGTAETASGSAAPVETGGAVDAASARHSASDSLRSRFPALSHREADVFEGIASGLNNSEIASRLFISVATVKSHINAIFVKLGVRDRSQAITLAHSAPASPTLER